MTECTVEPFRSKRHRVIYKQKYEGREPRHIFVYKNKPSRCMKGNCRKTNKCQTNKHVVIRINLLHTFIKETRMVCEFAFTVSMLVEYLKETKNCRWLLFNCFKCYALKFPYTIIKIKHIHITFFMYKKLGFPFFYNHLIDL